MKVKKLEWTICEEYDLRVVVLWGIRFLIEHYYDKTDVPSYRALINATPDINGSAMSSHDELVLGVCDTIEEAKAICQQHYEELIMSALETEDES